MKNIIPKKTNYSRNNNRTIRAKQKRQITRKIRQNRKIAEAINTGEKLLQNISKVMYKGNRQNEMSRSKNGKLQFTRRDN